MARYKKNTRMCIACRERADKHELLRFNKSKDGTVTLDSDGKSEGRGIYLHKKRECIAQLKKKKTLYALLKEAGVDELAEEWND